ncbi:putative cytochrome p450 [Lyophyllum shimeji]|uniref:Cytochrome p450 n=1 Tax=Lyophyllum shimeji TaxID=47721 RepID=A0A9P3PJ23_LYOSH|nr:putative cytochrome p450 [Lyophyllum shimeji]
MMREFLLTLLAAAAAHLVYRKLEPRRLLLHVILLLMAPLSLTPLLTPHFSSVVQAALAVWSIYLTSLVVCTVLYRLSPLHPLAKYPGPLICKVSKLWFGLVAYGGKQHIYYNELHRRYGDIVRIGPNELSFCTPDVIPSMMGAGGMPKAAFWDGQFPEQKTCRSLVGLRDPQEHARRRRIWSRGFTPEALRSYQPILDKRIGQLLDHLTARAGTTIDLAKWISWFSFDLMNDMAFGDKIELMKNEDSKGIWDLMEIAHRTALVMAHLPWLSQLAVEIPFANRNIKRFREFSRQRAMKRYKEGSASRDIFYHLIDEGGLEAARPAIEQVANDASLVIVAGSDTISPTLASLFYLIISNPVTYSRLQGEVDDRRVDINDVAALAQLPYLNAVINETMRVIPPVLSGSTRSPLIGSGGCAVGSHYIPEGTTAVVHTYTLHRDARNFSPFPESFIPERWLTADRQVALEPEVFKARGHVVHNLAAFIPFSYGPADCIGKRLAMQEMRAVACAVLRRFSLRFADGYDKATWEGDMCDHFVIKKPKLPVVLTLRQ